MRPRLKSGLFTVLAAPYRLESPAARTRTNLTESQVVEWDVEFANFMGHGSLIVSFSSPKVFKHRTNSSPYSEPDR